MNVIEPSCSLKMVSLLQSSSHQTGLPHLDQGFPDVNQAFPFCSDVGIFLRKCFDEISRFTAEIFLNEVNPGTEQSLWILQLLTSRSSLAASPKIAMTACRICDLCR